MNIDNHEKAIQQANTEVNRVRQKAEKITAEIKQIVPVFLDEWAKSIINSSVKDHPEIVKELGVEKIGQLKKKLADVTTSFPNSAKERLSTVKWTHQTDFTQEEVNKNTLSAYELKNKANEVLYEILRTIMGQVGVLLIEYGVAKLGDGWDTRSGGLRYSYGIPDHIGFPAGIQFRELRESYGKVIEEYLKAIKELRKAEQEKSVAEAENLWDQS